MLTWAETSEASVGRERQPRGCHMDRQPLRREYWPRDGCAGGVIAFRSGRPWSCLEISKILTHPYRPAETFSARAVEDCENVNLRNHAEPSKSGREKRETQKYTKKNDSRRKIRK